MAAQMDSFQSHSHVVNLNTNAAGAHNHTTNFYNDDYNNSGNGTPNGTGLIRDGGPSYTIPTNTANNHIHNVYGDTYTTGDTETRPINWGVNWIIKI
jgi:hypothetical protein